MFHSLAALTTLYDGYTGVFKINGLSLLLIQEEGQRYIIEDRCPHMDARLSTGSIIGSDITCRAHGISFCLKSGKAQGPLAHTLDGLRLFAVAYDGNQIGVDI